VEAPSIEQEAHYPYGLRLHLEKEELEALGDQVAELAKGDRIKLMCVAEVTGMSVSEDEYGDSASLTLQIQKMEVGAPAGKRTTVRNALKTLRGKKAP
jgi:hypothetical protein